MLFGAYGPGEERPEFRVREAAISTSGAGSGPESTDHLAFVELYFTLYRRDPSGADFEVNEQRYIVNWLRGTAGLHFEDTSFQWGELSFTPFDGFPIRNVTFRRSQFLDSWALDSQSHAQGVYLDQVQGIVFEECFWDHNGWNEQIPGAGRTVFNHNLYAGAPENLRLSNSLLMRGASHGTQMRSGGIAENNLFLHNAISLFFVSANQGGRVSGNVIVHGTDIDAANTRGWGMEIGDGGQTVEVSDNIISECLASACSNLSMTGDSGVYNGTVIYDWGGAAPPSPGPFVDPGRDAESYNETQGEPATIDAFSTVMRQQSRMRWNPAYRISDIVAYIRAGFVAP